MALVTDIRHATKERHSVHDRVECSYSTFLISGRAYLQLDTYGSKNRKLRGKTSQSIQFDAQSAKQLKELIVQTFPEVS